MRLAVARGAALDIRPGEAIESGRHQATDAGRYPRRCGPVADPKWADAAGVARSPGESYRSGPLLSSSQLVTILSSWAPRSPVGRYDSTPACWMEPAASLPIGRLPCFTSLRSGLMGPATWRTCPAMPYSCASFRPAPPGHRLRSAVRSSSTRRSHRTSTSCRMFVSTVAGGTPFQVLKEPGIERRCKPQAPRRADGHYLSLTNRW